MDKIENRIKQNIYRKPSLFFYLIIDIHTIFSFHIDLGSEQQVKLLCFYVFLGRLC